MISHGLTIVINELKKHLEDVYSVPLTSDAVQLGNLAEGITSGVGNGGIARGKIIFSVVNIKEEKTLKNLPNFVRNETTLRTTYENPPVFLNFQILITATDAGYSNALLMLSRAIRYFQSKNVFTQDDVSPTSISTNAPANALDRLESFKIIFNLYSPTMEEVNHLWGTLGGKQYPFAIYMMSMVDLKYRAVYNESGLITEIVNEFYHKNNS